MSLVYMVWVCMMVGVLVEHRVRGAQEEDLGQVEASDGRHVLLGSSTTPAWMQVDSEAC